MVRLGGMELLREKGADVAFSDPFFQSFPRMRKHQFELQSVVLTAETIASFDVVLLATDHDAFDYELISRHSQLLIDSRGRFAPGSQIVRA